ncbi:4'-phosphopantetheinyl transferase [Streptomyces sp. V4I23]|nr:4'-phosphopantetheinyl transferase [Streptomyces sp. V4I23]
MKTARFIPPDGQIDVWTARNSSYNARDVAVMSETLSMSEHAEVQRLRVHQHRIHRLLSRALLRRVLSHYAGLPPQALEIDRKCSQCAIPHGRPHDRSGVWQMSVTHSGDLWAVAVTSNYPVGLDAEELEGRTVHHVSRLADESFTPLEREALPSWEPPAEHLVLQHWTHKEAVLKCLGTGLTIPIQSVQLLAPLGRRQQVSVDTGSEHKSLYVESLDIGQLWVSALACAAPWHRVVVRSVSILDDAP